MCAYVNWYRSKTCYILWPYLVYPSMRRLEKRHIKKKNVNTAGLLICRSDLLMRFFIQNLGIAPSTRLGYPGSLNAELLRWAEIANGRYSCFVRIVRRKGGWIMAYWAKKKARLTHHRVALWYWCGRVVIFWKILLRGIVLGKLSTLPCFFAALRFIPQRSGLCKIGVG